MTNAKDANPKTCGECNLCCRLMGVAEIGKKRMHWCEFAIKGKGCKIYDIRPTACAQFECMWLWSQRPETPTRPFPTSLKPSVCGVVMDSSADGDNLVAHYNDGVSITEPSEVNKFLGRISDTRAVLVKQGRLTMVVRQRAVVAQQTDPTDDEPVSTVEIK
jgi:hypothetical protein